MTDQYLPPGEARCSSRQSCDLAASCQRCAEYDPREPGRPVADYGAVKAYGWCAHFVAKGTWKRPPVVRPQGRVHETPEGLL